ncbi:hypothetical protein ABS71_19205 [bacterium SCN 62-11]|nr:MAG: hypothetical protein ABS71_19205 [bacterium SCN 62-11]
MNVTSSSSTVKSSPSTSSSKPASQPAAKAEPKSEPSVAILDEFRGAEVPGTTTHGELVEGVLLSQGLQQDDVKRIQVSPQGDVEQLWNEMADGQEDALDRYIETRIGGVFEGTTSALEEIVQDKESSITTVNQSQGMSEGLVLNQLTTVAREYPEFKDLLRGQVGLPAEASGQEIVQALADTIGDVNQNSPVVQQARERYQEISQQLAERGISHVLAAGNEGETEDSVLASGIETGPDFFRNILANDNTTVVGGVDAQGGNAWFNANAGAEISALGVDVSILTADGAQVKEQNGTSFAAPLVAAADARLAAAFPQLTAQQREGMMAASAIPVDGQPGEVGAGLLNLMAW